jgi:HSP20 family protein
MATMMRWDPFQDLRSAQDEMAQMSPMTQMSPMLAHALGLHAQPQGNDRATAWAPALDISERKDAYLVTVELPGVEPDDLQITLEDGLLTIQGERQFTSESSEQQFHRIGGRYGAPLRRLPPLDHPARPGPGRADRGLVRQRGAADHGAQGRGGHSEAHPGTPRPGRDPCGKQ